MKKKLMALLLTGILSCVMSLPAMAAGKMDAPLISAHPMAEEQTALPDSVLYYGRIAEIKKDKSGTISQIRLESDRYGEYVMIASAETFWIDSGDHTAFMPADLKVGENVYVFHSPVSTRSLPPQSAAFAVVRNVPMDIGCAQYHEVETVEEKDGAVTITTDNGGLLLRANQNTEITRYGEDAACTLEDIQPGVSVMAWYSAVAESYPGQAYANHVMILPATAAPVAEEPMTRAELITLLHEKAGKPVVNYAMSFSDVTEDAVYAEAIRWAASERFANGYGNGRFGPDDVITREQAAAILWRIAGSPVVTEDDGLSQYEDADEISGFARQAMVWAYQMDFIGQDSEALKPQAPVMERDVKAILDVVPFGKSE